MAFRFVAFAAVCAWLSAPAAFGQDEAASEPESEADVGGPRLSAEIRGVSYYTDNFYYQPSNELSAYGWLVNPKLGYLTETSKLRLSGLAEGEYGAFDTPGTADDYLDGHGKVGAEFAATARSRFLLDLDGRHGHDPFGINRTESSPAVVARELDQWNEGTLRGRYLLGTPAATLNAELGASGRRRTYTTNRDVSQVLDFDASTLDSVLFYNVTAKTSFVLDAARTNYDFNYKFSAADDRSGNLYQARLGARWLATAKTSGDVRVGYRVRTFDDGREKREGFDWDAAIRWSPVWPSTLELKAARREQPSYLSGVAIIDLSESSLTWVHPWTPLLHTKLGYVYTRANYVGSARHDDYQNGLFELDARLTKLVTLVGSYGVADRQSTSAAREFERSFAFLGIRIGR